MATMRKLFGASDPCGGQVSEARCDAIVATRVTASVLAVIGCAFIVGMIVLFRTFHNYGQRLILNLTIAAMLNTLPYFLGHQSEGDACTFQAFAVTWLNWNVLAWVLCLTHKLSLNILYQRAAEEWERTYYALGYGLGFVVAVVPLAMGSYGPAGVWCWIKDDDSNTTALRFGIWYVPLWIAIVVLFVANFTIIRSVRAREKRWEGTYNPDVAAEKEFLSQQIQPLKYYPLIYMLCMLFPTANRIQNAASPGEPVFALLLLHSITSPLQGFLNALVYAANTDNTIWRQCNPAGIKRAIMIRKGGEVGVFPSTQLMAEHTGANDTDSDSEVIDP